MAATKVSIVNKVLRKLRESTVSTISGNTYPELITDFLNETKREVEDAWNWKALRVETDVATVASTSQYTLTGTYERSIIFDVYNKTENYHLVFDPLRTRDGLKVTTPSEGSPLYWNYAGYDASGNMLIDVYPVPNAVQTLVVTHKRVQGELLYTTPSEVILTPEHPLFLGAYARAVEERGEDDGETYSKAWIKYMSALSDAIAIENSTQGDEHSVWEVE